VGFSHTGTGGSLGASLLSTIARAPNGTDIKTAQSGGATTSISVNNSNYSTTNTSGGGSITGSNNESGAPALAADGYHQLPTSTATINQGLFELGTTDGDDIDGQYRTIDGIPDIGADEIGHPTVIRFACAPAAFVLGSGPSSCHVEVDDATSSLYTGGPEGTVAFSSDQPGSFSAPSCVLDPVGIGSKTGECDVVYTPSVTGTHSLTGTYSATSLFHEPSQGGTALTVTPPGGSGDEVKPPVRRCKKPRKKTRAAKKKFKKCKRRLRGA
jgi:hypothetical protein